MNNPDQHSASLDRIAKWLLYTLFGFTLIAGIGYATFGRHPEWLQHVPQVAGFFGVSFTFFAQGHILLTAGVLLIYLIRATQFRWIGAFLAVYALSLSSELTGTATGLPFGPYSYTELLGIKWFNLVPLLIPLSWFTMALPGYYIAHLAFPAKEQAVKRIGFAALLLTLWDLALDPAMSFLTPYWQWGEAGAYYGMPYINLAGWFITGLVLMTALHLLKTDAWLDRLSVRWMASYYLLVLLLPLIMVAAGQLWLAAALTTITIGLCLYFVYTRAKDRIDEEQQQEMEREATAPDRLEPEQLNDYFAYHSRSFSFAARFFSPEQYRLVTRLYAFCRTTDDIADIYAASHGKEEAIARLEDWEQQVQLSFQGIPSGITWLDELMKRSFQSGLPFDVISDLIAGVRSDLDKVAFQTIHELNRYTYCVASVVGIWLCYLFGVRERKVLDRAAAMGRAMQITNILRDVGEDLRMHRRYIPLELMQKYGITQDQLLAMEAGTLKPTESYKILVEDLIERAEADYNFSFRGLTALPASFARAAAVASQVYRGIHRSIRRNRYNNFQRRAFTRWYEKAFLTLRGLNQLRKTQKRPFIPANQSYELSKNTLNGGRSSFPFTIYTSLFLVCVGTFSPSQIQAMPATDALPHNTHTIHHQYPMYTTDQKLIEQLRTQYVAAVTDEELITDALATISQLKNPQPVIQAYEAAFIILKAKHVFWPTKKMRHLNEGLPKLDALVDAHPLDVEIRYLRLLSCYYLPRFLGRSDSVDQDMKALAHLLPRAGKDFPTTLYQDMVRFVASSKILSSEEVNTLNLLLQQKPTFRSTAS